MRLDFYDFARESCKIEGIKDAQAIEGMCRSFAWFLPLELLTVEDVVKFASELGPKCVLRDKPGMDVRIGAYRPPEGGKYIKACLADVLLPLNFARPIEPIHLHKEFEGLHPFMDGNGRTGRAIWLWQMLKEGKDVSLGFLHTWYYQSLSDGR